MEINGIAHILLRASRFEECVAFYDALMPRLPNPNMNESGPR